ncbi:MAG: PAS domain-containing sensor histidine kinase, partial [Clostridium sp.]|nr:PAS domain-containing sensor histidine kinase [Clostridium sp.]
KIKADDIAIYLYNRHSNNMSLYVQEGSTKGIFTTKYSFNVFGQFLLNSKLNKIVRNFNGCQTHYLYPIRAKDTLHGMIEIYYKNDDSKHYIGESIIKQISILLGVSLENRTIAKHLKTELIKREDVQKKLEMVIDTVIDIYALIKKKNNMLQWIDINKKCMEIIEWTDKDLIDRSPLELVHADDKEDLKFAVENHKEYKNFVCRILCKSGNYKILSINWSNISNGNIIITGKDITNERELLKDKENLQQAVEVESLKTEFFANLSHEFKTPLTAIIGYSELIPRLENKNDIEESSVYIKKEGERLLKLVEELLDLSKLGKSEFNVYRSKNDLATIIEEALNIIQPRLQKYDIDIIKKLCNVNLYIDKDKTKQVILNVLDNAIKYSECTSIILKIKETNNDIELTIMDDGIGIEKSHLNKLFEPIYRVNKANSRSKNGNGLGLCICKEIMRKQDGDIEIYSEENKWTLVKIIFSKLYKNS